MCFLILMMVVDDDIDEDVLFYGDVGVCVM